MEMVTLKQYADSKGISYEAVRKQVNRYHSQLKDHIVVKNRTQYIDEWAVNFLTERRRESPIVLVTEEQQEKIQSLMDQIETLKSQLLAAQNELLSEKDHVISLQTERQQLIEAKADMERAIVQHEEDQKRMEELMNERDQARAEAESYERSIFGFYRKKRI